MADPEEATFNDTSLTGEIEYTETFENNTEVLETPVRRAGSYKESTTFISSSIRSPLSPMKTNTLTGSSCLEMEQVEI